MGAGLRCRMTIFLSPLAVGGDRPTTRLIARLKVRTSS